MGETGWSGSGGGASTVEAKPSYQSSVTLGGNYRTGPDVAYNADPYSGAAIYDTCPGSTTSGWLSIGGTSAGAPQWAALIALADQVRVMAGSGSLDGFPNTLPRIYGLPAGDFHDIVSGTAGGNAAGSGYDLVAGRGSPRVDLVVADLARNYVSTLPGTFLKGSLLTGGTSLSSAPRATTVAQTAPGTASPSSAVDGVFGKLAGDPAPHGDLAPITVKTAWQSSRRFTDEAAVGLRTAAEGAGQAASFTWKGVAGDDRPADQREDYTTDWPSSVL